MTKTLKKLLITGGVVIILGIFFLPRLIAPYDPSWPPTNEQEARQWTQAHYQNCITVQGAVNVNGTWDVTCSDASGNTFSTANTFYFD